MDRDKSFLQLRYRGIQSVQLESERAAGASPAATGTRYRGLLRSADLALLNKNLASYQPIAYRHLDRCQNNYDSRMPRRRNALAITETELSAIAAAATIGLSNSPRLGYSTPAASGTPAAL